MSAEPEERQQQLSAREIRSCTLCGARFSATAEHELCPVCILQGASAGGTETPEASVQDPAGSGSVHRLEHYELVTDEAGQLVELGRGAMGITYKAMDVDLQCPVTLKVISERFLGDETARVRFVRKRGRRRVCVIPTSLPSST